MISERLFAELRAPVRRVGARRSAIPFSPALEKQLYPSRTTIADAVRRVAGELACRSASRGLDQLATQAPR